MRARQTGYGFVIAAAPATDGRTLMVASQCVRDIEINHDYTNDYVNIVQWGGRVRSQSDTTITASLATHEQHPLVHVNVEQGGYAEAWRRLFDVWVPPQFTDETRTQILTHYIFGGP